MTRPVLAPISSFRAVVSLSLLLAAPCLAYDLPRAPFRAFDTARAPRDVCLADFDHDGHLDVATSNLAEASISVLLGVGDGTLRNRTDLEPGGYSSESVASGDLDGDGDRDIVFLKGGYGLPEGSAGVLLGNGDGTFVAASDAQVGISPDAVELADLDKDGHLDMVVANADEQMVSVLLGLGDGTFQPRVTLSVDGPSALAIGDINGDTRLDLAVASGGNVAVLLGNGDGAFAPASYFSAGFQVNSVALGDLNGDGRPDIACASAIGISVLLGNGDGTLQPRTSFPGGNGSRGITLADLDGDGKLDAVDLAYFGDAIDVLLGNGDGTFRDRVAYPTGVNPWSAAVGDLNGDGRLDLVVTDTYWNDLSVLLGNGDGTFGYQNDTPVGSRPTIAVLGDFDGDANLDVAVANRFSPSVSLLAGHGDGTLAPAVDVPAASGVYCLAMGDLNRDGSLDLVTGYEYTPNGVSVLLATGGMNFAPHVEYPTSGRYVTAVATGDLNGDGAPDVVSAESDVAVLIGNGDGTLQPAVLYPAAGTEQLALADVNEDHRLDAVVRSTYAVGVMLGNGDGTLGDYTIIDYPGGSFPLGLATADLDEDGHLDIILGWGGVGVLRGRGDGTFGALETHVTNKSPNAFAAADLNGDGHLDVVASNGDWNTVTVLLGHGDGSFDPKVDLGTGGRPYYSVVAGDLNHDDRLDLIVPGHFSNSVHVLLSGSEAVVVPMALSLPRALSLRSLGHWVTAYLQPPAGFDASAIDVSSIRLHGNVVGADPVPVDPAAPTAIGDENGDYVPDLMVKFDRARVELAVTAGEAVPVTVTGIVAGQPFGGATQINVLKAKITAPRAGSILEPGAVSVVRWETPEGVTFQSVALLFSLDDGRAWTLVAKGTPNSGSYSWTVPAVASNRARVAVVLVESADTTGYEVDGVLGVSERFAIGSPMGVGDGAQAEFALREVKPTPGRVTLQVEFSLPDARPARLEVLDVSGRRVSAQDVGVLGPGRHMVELRRGPHSGVYFVRLSQPGRAQVLRTAAMN